MPLPFSLVDAFSNRPFGGNQAGVCLLPERHEGDRDAWMPRVARELNVSETAFIEPLGDRYRLRWFTPQVEVDLCGHGTLAAAHVLAEAGMAPAGETIGFETRSGLLTAIPRAGGWLELDFPTIDVAVGGDTTAHARALGIAPTFAGMAGPKHFFEVTDEDVVRSLRPDFDALRKLPGRAIIVTSRATTAGFDFVSRYFAPWVGVEEDPVTGSAHCALATYWAEKTGGRSFRAWQASARGGEVRVELAGDRVHLLGQAVTVARGELLA